MKEEVKKLITAEMLSDVLGESVQIKDIDNTCIYIKELDMYRNYPDGFISIYELKDKLEEWACSKGLYTALKERGKLWQLDIINDKMIDIACSYAPTKFEALLKLYHAVKADK